MFNDIVSKKYRIVNIFIKVLSLYYYILKNDIKTNSVSLHTLSLHHYNYTMVRCAMIKIKNSPFAKSDARGPQNLCRHSLTYVKYDAWHWRELFYVNVRQDVHQVSFAAGGET